MADRLRILFIVSEFMYSSQVRTLCDLVAGLNRDRFEIEIGALDVGDEATPEIEKLEVPFYWLPVHPPRGLEPKRLLGFLGSPFSLRRKNFDIVHSLLYQSLFAEALLVKAFTPAKYIYSKTNLQWDNHPINWYLKSKLADRIISISGATDELLTRKGFGEKLSTIYLGIDTEVFQSSPRKRRELRRAHGIGDGTFVFGCAAQYIKVKDHPTLIRAFEHVCKRRDNVHLLLCGPNHRDQYHRDIKERIARSPYSARITDLGTVSDMPAFYSALDCFVLPSYWEAFGYVLCEAMSCNLPCIACRVLGPTDIVVDSETGFLCRPRDTEEMAVKMSMYAGDRQLAAHHGKNGRKQAVEVFSKEAMARDCMALYSDIVSK